MSQSNYPNGFEHGVNIRGVPILNTYAGNVYWVGKTPEGAAGSDAYDGTYNWPKATIAYLFSADIVKAGDRIMVKPDHVETVAGAVAWDIAGVCIVMGGEGTSKAYFNLTATGSYINVTGAGITLINPKFVTGIDAVAKGLQVAAADFSMVNTEYHDAAAMASTIQVLTTSAATRLYINGYRYYASTTGTQKTDGIKTVGALDGVVLHNIQIVGDFSTAPIDISQAITNVDIDNLNLNNTNTDPQPAMEIHANTTGFAENVKCRIASGTDYVSSTAKIQWGAMCQGYNTDGSGGAAIGSATDITAAVDSVGVNTSTIISDVRSVGVNVSAAVSTAISHASAASSKVTTATTYASQASQAGSLAASSAQSVGLQVSTVSLGVSVVLSHVGSVGTYASMAYANTVSTMTSTASQAASVGTGTSMAHAQGMSITTQVASQALSVGIGASLAHAQVMSLTTQNASQALSVALGASQAYANTVSIMTSTASQALSVALGASQAYANTVSIMTSTASQALSVGIGASTAVNNSAQAVSMLTSIALIISLINSKT
jgi:hypothetical protein